MKRKFETVHTRLKKIYKHKKTFVINEEKNIKKTFKY